MTASYRLIAPASELEDPDATPVVVPWLIVSAVVLDSGSWLATVTVLPPTCISAFASQS